MTELTQADAQKILREGLTKALNAELRDQETKDLLTAACETFYVVTDGQFWSGDFLGVSTTIAPDEGTFPFGTFVSLFPVVQSEEGSFGGLFTFTAGEKDPRPVASLFVNGKIDGDGKHTFERAHYRSREMNPKQVFTGVAALAMSATSKLPQDR